MVLVAALLATSAGATFVSLMEDPRYSSQRPCATGCFYLGAFPGPDNLAQAVGCRRREGSENECICRPDLQVQADAYLSSCVNSACDKKTLDIETARAIYSDYCTSNGYTRSTSTPAEETGTQPPPATVAVLVTVVQTVTQTVTQTAASSSGERLAKNWLGALVAQAVALLVYTGNMSVNRYAFASS